MTQCVHGRQVTDLLVGRDQEVDPVAELVLLQVLLSQLTKFLHAGKSEDALSAESQLGCLTVNFGLILVAFWTTA